LLEYFAGETGIQEKQHLTQEQYDNAASKIKRHLKQKDSVSSVSPNLISLKREDYSFFSVSGAAS
jgi:hypothetical protein